MLELEGAVLALESGLEAKTSPRASARRWGVKLELDGGLEEMLEHEDLGFEVLEAEAEGAAPLGEAWAALGQGQ